MISLRRLSVNGQYSPSWEGEPPCFLELRFALLDSGLSWTFMDPPVGLRSSFVFTRVARRPSDSSPIAAGRLLATFVESTAEPEIFRSYGYLGGLWESPNAPRVLAWKGHAGVLSPEQ